jgi:hypothetical protein
MGSNIGHLQTADASDFPYRHVSGAALFKMAIITIILALDFAIMRPMVLHRSKGAQFQRQGLESAPEYLKAAWVVFH